MKDYLVRGLSSQHHVRAFACHTTQLCDHARLVHGLWPTASAALGRVMSATLMMGAMNKNAERLTVNIYGGGPIGTVMAVTNSDGKVKGFVGEPSTHYTYNDTGKLAVGYAVGKEGYLQVIKDMGLKEPFSSQVPLQTGEIGEDFAYYFAASEQVPSVVSLGVLVETDNRVEAAGGFILQLLPDATEEDITYLEEKMRDFPSVSSLIQDGKSPEDILSMIFEDIEILETIPLSYECDCYRERMQEVLMSLGQQELQAMIDEDHGCEIRCQFCNEIYHFNEDDLTELIHRIS